jgi:hypothetical protein
MANTLVLPVAEKVLALYVVAAPEHLPPGLLARDRAGLGEYGAPPVDIEPRVDVIGTGDPPLSGLLDLLDCPACGPHADPQELSRIRTADRHLIVAAANGPGWPPLHMWTAGTTAEALTVATGGILLDPDVPFIGPGPGASCALRDRELFQVVDWIEVAVADEDDPRAGRWLATSGLPRFGLPELQIHQVPAGLDDPWTAIINGLAQLLLQAHWDSLAARPGLAFREFPDTLTLTSADITHATGRPLPPAATRIRLRLDLGSPDDTAFLTILPPRGYRGTEAHWRKEVSAALSLA